MIKEELTGAHSKAYKKYEKEDGSVQAARVAEGNIFLELQLLSKLIIVKTIISDEMLYDDQKEAFGDMKETLDEIKDIKIYYDQICKSSHLQPYTTVFYINIFLYKYRKI